MYLSASKTKWVIIGVIILFGLGLVWFTVPQFFSNPQKKPEIPHYEYYQIVDEANGETLMYVSVIKVNEGDELVTDSNKWYRVVRIENNIAYARQFDKSAEQTNPTQKDNTGGSGGNRNF